MADSFGAAGFPPAVLVGYFGRYQLSRVAALGSTNATSITTTPSTVGGFFLSNKNAALRFFKFYDKASAPSVGTDTPLFTIPIAPNANPPSFGSFADICFVNGIAYAITTGIADSDTGAVSADDVHGFFQYTSRPF